MSEASIARTNGWEPGTFLRGEAIIGASGRVIERPKLRYITAIGQEAVLVRDVLAHWGAPAYRWGSEATGTFSARSWSRIDLCGACHHCIALSSSVHTWAAMGVGMILCPTCGCKRCPRATDHRRFCTKSNQPGQPGSIYGDADLISLPAWMEGMLE